jgi:hypothetical protein
MSSQAARKAWATRRARAKAVPPMKRLLALAKEQSRWMRKETIARNKLKRVQFQIAMLAEEFITKQNPPDTDNVWAKRKITSK